MVEFGLGVGKFRVDVTGRRPRNLTVRFDPDDDCAASPLRHPEIGGVQDPLVNLKLEALTLGRGLEVGVLL